MYKLIDYYIIKTANLPRETIFLSSSTLITISYYKNSLSYGKDLEFLLK